MVSRETSVSTPTHLTPDFIAGVISVTGTFIHIHSARVEQFGFQIKMAEKNRALLDLIRVSLAIKTPIRKFKEGNTDYVLLITRSRKILIKNIIPFIDDRLIGPKLKDYLQWKEKLLKYV